MDTKGLLMREAFFHGHVAGSGPTTMAEARSAQRLRPKEMVCFQGLYRQ
jgi:hypothetical protein